jgi:hypothetical protein
MNTPTVMVNYLLFGKINVTTTRTNSHGAYMGVATITGYWDVISENVAKDIL